MMIQTRIESRIEHGAARLLHAHLATIDREEARDEAIEVLAAQLYDLHVGDVMQAGEIGEAIGEVLAGMDRDEMAACVKAYAAGDDAFGRWLRPQIAAYWQAWCLEEARQQMDRLDREAEEDHYRAQVAA